MPEPVKKIAEKEPDQVEEAKWSAEELTPAAWEKLSPERRAEVRKQLHADMIAGR
jgi:acyl-CoA reductase-like NAD-dependent aldehyde dehydrogenase